MPDFSLHSTSFQMNGPGVLVHGGAWAIPDDALDDHRDGLRASLFLGRRMIQSGAPAVEVVTATVAALESHGAFDAGRGAMLNQDGEVELDAGVMDGSTLSYGSVIAIQNIEHPVRVARRLMDVGEGKVRILSGTGAKRFAEGEGFPTVGPETLISEREQARFERLKAHAERFHPSETFLPGAVSSDEEAPSTGHDTVGCVARDADGNLAVATSTGGTPFKPPGRVGDSPLPGAGFYANAHAAACATGWGEAIAAVVLSSRTVDAVARGEDPETVVRERLTDMHACIQNPDGEGATGGLLLLTADGHGIVGFTTPRMARAAWYDGTAVEPKVRP